MANNFLLWILCLNKDHLVIITKDLDKYPEFPRHVGLAASFFRPKAPKEKLSREEKDLVAWSFLSEWKNLKGKKIDLAL